MVAGWGAQNAAESEWQAQLSPVRSLGLQVVAALRERVPVLPFHRAWIRSVFQPDIQIGVLSCPRGAAKTWIAAQLAALALRPGSPTFQKGIEVLGVSASLEQSRVLLNFVREALADVEAEYRWLDSGQRLACTHKPTGTKLRILSSSGKRAMGLANFSTIFADEPGSWERRGGALMWDALRQALGKRAGQKLLVIGTRAPGEEGSWWPSLVDGGSGPGTHVTELSAPPDEPWDSWQTIRRVNPLVLASASLRRTILRERDDARRNPTMRPAFEAYRLNRSVAVGLDAPAPGTVIKYLIQSGKAACRGLPGNLSPFNGVSLPHFAVAEKLRWAWSENRSVARMNGLEAEAHAVAPGIDLHEALEGVKLTEGRIPKRGIFARALAVVDPRAQVVRSVSLSDVPAIGHEYGHLMQKLVRRIRPAASPVGTTRRVHVHNDACAGVGHATKAE